MEPKTPDKSIINKSFSPITLQVSPAALSPHRNITGLPRVARDIAADVYNNIQQWNDNHIAGANIIKNITYLKCDSTATYPSGIEQLTTDLHVIVEKLLELSMALENLTSQMESLVKLHKKSSPLFFSMTNDELVKTIGAISDAYKLEVKVKEEVLENIAHCKNKSELMYYAVSWTHQPFITSNVTLKLETLLVETGHRQII